MTIVDCVIYRQVKHISSSYIHKEAISARLVCNRDQRVILGYVDLLRSQKKYGVLPRGFEPLCSP